MAASSLIGVRLKLKPTVREIPCAEQSTEPAASPERRTGHYPRAAPVLALALQFQEMTESGEVRDYTDLARLGCVSRERIGQIMMLVWLAPDIREEVLCWLANAGCARFSEGALRRIAKMPIWEEQGRAVRNRCGEPKATE